MRMKSILALSALSIAAFFGSAAHAADAQTSSTAPLAKDIKQLKQASDALSAKKTSAAADGVPSETPAENKAANADPIAPNAKQTDALPPAGEANPEQAQIDVNFGDDKPAKPAKQKKSKRTKSKKHKSKHKHKHSRKGHHHHYAVPQQNFHERHAPKQNFLLGGELGYASQKGEFVAVYTAPGIIPIYTNHSSKVTDGGVLFGLLGGWQGRCGRTLYGIEANVDFHDFEKNKYFVVTEVNNAVTQGTILYDRGTVYGLTGRLGYFVTSFFMPYIRLGVQFSEDELNYQAFLLNPNPPGQTLPDYSHVKRVMWAPVGGIGAEFPTQIGNSTIRFEYNFTRDPKSLIIDDNLAPIFGSYKLRYPETNMGKVSWVWNFM